MTRHVRPVEWSAKVYALLVRGYPESFRRDYGNEMTRVFHELADDAWIRGGWLGLCGVWRRVLFDLARTVPGQQFLEWQGASQMKNVPPVTALGLGALSIGGAFAINLALFAVLNALLWVGWASGAMTSYQHWPPVYLPAMLGTLLPPLMTGFVAKRARLLFRPELTAPVGTMLFAAAWSFADSRAPWLISVGYPSLVGAATLLGCYLATKVWGRGVAACAA